MPLDDDLRNVALLLGIQSPSLRLLRGYHKVDVIVSPTTSFVAKTSKRANDRYEVTLSVGVWIALNFMLRQGVAGHKDDPDDALEIAIDKAALFTGDGRMRVIRLAELKARKNWNWYEAPSTPVDGELKAFVSGYLAPTVNDGAYDLRVELAVAFLTLHEMNHVMQGHFDSGDNLSVVDRQRLEVLSDVHAACGFPGLMDHCAAMFSVDGRKRCNILIAAGLSIGCAVFCLQMLNRSAVDYPSPTARMMALVTLMGTGFLPTEIAKSDREYLVAGMWYLLKAFDCANDDLTIHELEALTLGLAELDREFSARPSQYVLEFAEVLKAQGIALGHRHGEIDARRQSISARCHVSEFERPMGIMVRNAFGWISSRITSYFSAKH